jgi:hypothetical protein
LHPLQHAGLSRRTPYSRPSGYDCMDGESSESLRNTLQPMLRS